MPNITTAATFTKDTAGFGNLKASPRSRVFLFAGSSVGSSTVIQYTDDTGTARTLSDGDITDLPTSIQVDCPGDLQIVTTGTPDFNVTVRLQQTRNFL